MAKGKNQYQEMARQIVDAVGGDVNVTKVIHCVTRLRFFLKDDEIPVNADIENIDGVMGVIEAGGQYQVVVGQAVDDIFKEVQMQLTNSGHDKHEEPKPALTGKKRVKAWFNELIGIITGSMMPIISILSASGIIKSLLAVLTTTGLITAEGSIYLIINAMADAVFYFLPVLIGYNAAKRIDGNPILTAVIGGVIIHPTVIEAANNSLNILSFGNLNFPFVSYTYSIFPMILAAWMVKKLEAWLKTWVSIYVQAIFIPMVVIGFVSAVTFILTGPVITWLSQGLAVGLQTLLTWNAPIFGAVIDGFYQILVIFGLHWGIIPIYVNDFATLGYSYLSAMVSMPIVAQGGAALAVAIKSKKPKIKELGYAGAISAFSGITEPAIYGINLRFRKPFIMASIASAVGGFLTGVFKINMWSIIGSIIGLPSFIDPVNGITSNFCYAVFVTFLTLALSFVLTYIWGYNDDMVMAEKREKPINPGKRK